MNEYECLNSIANSLEILANKFGPPRMVFKTIPGKEKETRDLMKKLAKSKPGALVQLSKEEWEIFNTKRLWP